MGRTTTLSNRELFPNIVNGLQILAGEMRYLRKALHTRQISSARSEAGKEERHQRTLEHLQDCVASGVKVIDTAASYVSSELDAAAARSVKGVPMSKVKAKQIHDWIPPPVDREATPFVPPTETPFIPERKEDKFTPATEHTADSMFSQRGGAEPHTTATSTQYTETVRDQAGPIDLEAQVIEHFQKLGKLRHEQGKYDEAEQILNKALQRGEKRFDSVNPFKNKEETIALLASSYIKQGKYDSAETLMQSYEPAQFQRETTLEVLISAYVKENAWEKAEEALLRYTPIHKVDIGLHNLATLACTKNALDFAQKFITKHDAFEGRENLLETIAMQCYDQRKWDEAATFLNELLKATAGDEGEDGNGAKYDAVHMLADVYLQKNNLERAENRCRQAVEGRLATLGKDNPKFHQSVYLLVEICHAREDPYEAEVMSQFLPQSYQRTSPSQFPSPPPRISLILRRMPRIRPHIRHDAPRSRPKSRRQFPPRPHPRRLPHRLKMGRTAPQHPRRRPFRPRRRHVLSHPRLCRKREPRGPPSDPAQGHSD
jgi:tetratricopeptide (TPR) repeat protein